MDSSEHDLLIRIAAQVELLLTNHLPHMQDQINDLERLMWGIVIAGGATATALITLIFQNARRR